MNMDVVRIINGGGAYVENLRTRTGDGGAPCIHMHILFIYTLSVSDNHIATHSMHGTLVFTSARKRLMGFRLLL